MALITLNDAWYQWLVSALPTSAGGTGAGTTANTSQVANQYESQANVGTQTAPVAFTPVATVTVANAGFYRIKCSYGYGGTAETATADNFQLVVQATAVTNLPATVSNTNTLFPVQEVFKKLNAGDQVKINSGATNGSAGSVYKAFLTVDRLA